MIAYMKNTAKTAKTTAPEIPAEVAALVTEIRRADRAITSAYHAAPRGGPSRDEAAQRFSDLRIKLKKEHGYLFIADGTLVAPGDWTPCPCSDC